MARADAAGFAARRAAAKARGRLLGIGVACFLETSRGAPNEGAEVRFESDGKVMVAVGTESNGQGHETAFAQIAADRLGVPIEAIRYVQADTGQVKSGAGHGGARSMHMGGAAVVKAIDATLAKARDARGPSLAGVGRRAGLRRRAFRGAGQRPRHRPAGAGAERGRSGQPAGRHDERAWACT